MAIIAVGTASFTTGGAETATFTWSDVFTGAPVTFGVAPSPSKVFGPFQSVTIGGAGVPFLDGAGALTTTGGTITCANPGTMTAVVWAVG